MFPVGKDLWDSSELQESGVRCRRGARKHIVACSMSVSQPNCKTSGIERFEHTSQEVMLT